MRTAARCAAPRTTPPPPPPHPRRCRHLQLSSTAVQSGFNTVRASFIGLRTARGTHPPPVRRARPRRCRSASTPPPPASARAPGSLPPVAECSPGLTSPPSSERRGREGGQSASGEEGEARGGERERRAEKEREAARGGGRAHGAYCAAWASRQHRRSSCPSSPAPAARASTTGQVRGCVSSPTHCNGGWGGG